MQATSKGYLPPQITYTTGGLGYYLSKIWNVVKSQQNVASIWDCEPDQIKILGLDLGQTCILGASALLPYNTLEGTYPDGDRDTEKKTCNNEDLDDETGNLCHDSIAP
ncbi:hypothetical protein BGZ49_003014 [Haplosporangium sp. Z 27]|nr:hypothetical protein BGZ49_003014 [Haplosporangium sp. Z 27]